MRWRATLPEIMDWLLNCPYAGAWWENELKVLEKWLELLLLPLQLLLTETGFCSACRSTNARLGAAMFGEGLVLVTSGDISCFRHSGRVWRGSEVVVRAGGWENGKQEVNMSGGKKTKMEWMWRWAVHSWCFQLWSERLFSESHQSPWCNSDVPTDSVQWRTWMRGSSWPHRGCH